MSAGPNVRALARTYVRELRAIKIPTQSELRCTLEAAAENQTARRRPSSATDPCNSTRTFRRVFAESAVDQTD